MQSEILQPVVALLIWSLVIWSWMYATRIPAVVAMKMVLDPNVPKGEQMATLPPNVRWKADNYNHLMEAPTMFYAVALTLAVAGAGHGVAVAMAWVYVGLRIIHSLVQVTSNHIPTRFAVFVLSTLAQAVLVALAVRAVF
ncbi:MAG: MAPEG family protein [Rhodocyclaceae bacterium]|nr:MAPEG family protein [Rhodocyclaceae bacterium]